MEKRWGCGAKVIIVRPERPCAAVGRNAGWQTAAAPVVLFLDGDTLLHPDFVADCLPKFAVPRVAVVWGHRRELHPEASIYHRVLDLDWVYPPGPSEFCGGDALIRRAVLQEVGGYDERLIAGEEPEMCRRIRDTGYVILHVDRPMTGHDLAITRWSQYWRRAVRAGYAYAEVAERFCGTETPLWEHEVKRNRLHGAFLVGCPALALVSSLALSSSLPLVGLLVVSGGVMLRTVAKARWKSSDLRTLVLYSLHSHIQQVPILLGQLCYCHDRWLGRRRALIEYKELPS
jgi:Glycosyl transferase family group 2